MTDAEIIKALECFAIDKDSDELYCVGCAFETKGLCCENCSDGLAKASLDLINRSKAEIERLKGWQDLLKAEKHSLIKAEAINEFAERLKEELANILGCPIADTPRIIIDNLVKEMAGD